MPIKPCPKPFSFKNPQTDEEERGIVHKEVEIEFCETEHRDYNKVAQLLEWQNGESAWSIRFGYYLKSHGAKDDEWHWGAQTTSIISIEFIDTLMRALTDLKETYERKRP